MKMMVIKAWSYFAQVSLWESLSLFVLIMSILFVIKHFGRYHWSHKNMTVISLYLILVLDVTILGRKVHIEFTEKSALLKTYEMFFFHGSLAAFYDIVLNVIMCIPIGLFMFYGRSIWKIIIVTCCLSLFIETSQLILHCGRFEICDLIDNVVGGLLGYWIARLAQVGHANAG